MQYFHMSSTCKKHPGPPPSLIALTYLCSPLPKWSWSFTKAEKFRELLANFWRNHFVSSSWKLRGFQRESGEYLTKIWRVFRENKLLACQNGELLTKNWRMIDERSANDWWTIRELLTKDPRGCNLTKNLRKSLKSWVHCTYLLSNLSCS